MALTDKQIKAAQPADKQYKLYDSEGLLLLIHPNGSKYWRLKYRHQGKEKMLALGIYPKITLSEARKKKNEAKLLLEAGINPQNAKVDANEISNQYFSTYFEQWLDSKKASTSVAYVRRTRQRFAKSVFPVIGNMSVKTITSKDILAIAKNCEQRGALYTGKSVISIISQIYRWLIIHGVVEADPANRMAEAVQSYKPKNNPYLLEKELPEFLYKLSNYQGYIVAKIATRFLLLTMVRTSEMRFATWDELDFDKAEWRIPAARMKMERPHIVPLSKQVIALLEQLKPFSGGVGYVFPSSTGQNKPFSEVSILTIINQLGYKGRTTGHGFRACASTILNEHGWRADAIERQLAHSEGGGVRAKYNHAQYLDERRIMMQEWADLVDALHSQYNQGS